LRQAGEYLVTHGEPSAVVMAYDPAALNALTGSPGVAPPFDGFAVIGQVVDAYRVEWVVVTLRPGETRDPLGLWDGALATDAAGNHPDFLPSTPDYSAPRVRVYHVVADHPASTE
jgi:hypothetical protein